MAVVSHSLNAKPTSHQKCPAPCTGVREFVHMLAASTASQIMQNCGQVTCYAAGEAVLAADLIRNLKFYIVKGGLR